MVEPRPSATVVLVREVTGASRDNHFELFMVRRLASSGFAADAYVFPGGILHPLDTGEDLEDLCQGLTAADAERGFGVGDPRQSLGLWVAALRELFEEAGVLLAYEETGELLDLRDPERAAHFATYRSLLEQGKLSLAELARREGLLLATDRLRYYAHWITPAGMPRRYTTRFFLARQPEGQAATLSELEHYASTWITPRRALAAFEAGSFPLVFATIQHLRRLAGFDDLDTLMDFARHKEIHTVQPYLKEVSGGVSIIVPPEVEQCW